VISKRKKLKKTLDTAGVVRDALLILARHSLKAELQEFLESSAEMAAAMLLISRWAGVLANHRARRGFR